MAALTADKSRSVAGNGVGTEYPVAASTTIYAGALVSLNASGLAIPGADTASTTCVGIAAAGADNSSGSASDINVTVQRGQVETLNHTDLAQADVGKVVVVENDNSVTDAAGATNDIPAGVLLSISGSTCRVLVCAHAAGAA